jgi:6-carboxyhexanoate--CoA ligase
MKAKDLYSIRMRASTGRSHLSGAERLVTRDRIDLTVSELVKRALSKQLDPDQVIVTIDAINDIPVHSVPSLDLVHVNLHDLTACRENAERVLYACGVSPPAVLAAFRALEQGAAPDGGNMRGAMLIDTEKGERLEPDRARGVRVSRFDWSGEASGWIERELAALGLTHFRTKEALALATKVAHAPGIVAELCWSDDPDYTAGYVASRITGYVRFPQMKQTGNSRGGRAFFVRRDDLEGDILMTYLQETPVLIDRIGTCSAVDRLPVWSGQR